MVSLNCFSGGRAVRRRNLLLVGQTSEMDRECCHTPALRRAEQIINVVQRYAPNVLFC